MWSPGDRPLDEQPILSRRWHGCGAAHASSSRPLAALVAGLLIAAPAAAFELNGDCTLTIASTDAAGAPLDTAVGAPGGGQGGTQADPFIVDWDGTVAWNGASGSQLFKNHTWQTFVYVFPTPVRGGDPNEGEDTTGEGTTGVGENVPIQVTGLFFVSGEISGEGGTHCDGSGWFRLNGSPMTTIPFWMAVLIAILGAYVIWSSRPGTEVQ